MRDSLKNTARGETARFGAISPIDEAAEAWVRRLEAGLSVEEEMEFAEWLQSDARHEASFQKYRAAWDRFAPMAQAVAADSTASFAAEPAAHLASIEERRASRSPIYRRVVAIGGLAAAAAFAVMVFSHRQSPASAAASLALPGPCEQRTLADGSTVELNRGAQISVQFSDTERRIRLERGEASFTVTSNPNRPFIVMVGGIEVHAVGTAFNVRFDPRTVEVLVTEGKVRVADRVEKNPQSAGSLANSTPHSDPDATGTFLVAGQSAMVRLTPSAPPPHVAELTPAEIEARLAWQPRLLDFDDAPLSAIVAEFNRRNPVRLVVTDPVIANRRMTASFRSDNLEGFVRLIEANIAVKAEPLSGTEIALTRK